MTTVASTPSAAGVTWDLTDLYAKLDDPALAADLQTAQARAKAFEQTYRGKIASLTRADADLLAAAVREFESINEQMDRPLAFASLVHAAQTDVPKHGALLAHTREQRTAINKHLIFFELEWLQLDDRVADDLAADPKLARYRHWLQHKRAWKPHYLSEPEEKILDEKAITGKAAFTRLFEEITAGLRLSLAGPEGTSHLSLQEALAKLYDPDRDLRRRAADAISQELKKHSHVLTFIFNTIVLDHQSDSNLRGFAHPMASRNLANEVSDTVVEALLGATEKHFGLVQRYYRLKAKLLGLDRLYDYDRYAPLFAEMPPCDWPTARRVVQESYDAFSPEAGAVVRRFFEQSWIDAALRPGKRGGAFSSSTVPSVHPYILLNFTDRLRDVMTLAHELGHGLHQYLARGRGYLQCDTPLTTAEMASVFGEMLTFRRLLALSPQPRARLALLCSKIEDAFATVFRQVVLTRFEQRLHDARARQGELSAETINHLWQTANQAMFGDSVTLTEGYAWWWQYIGHFIRAPFYCYAYAFGELLVLALFQKYQHEGAAFVPRYLELLAAGGSDAPHRLLARIGVDVNDPGFWELGLALLGEMVGDAEALAATI
ncbi:MAG: M3 family oligoendopeptidase [Gemmataceae bacterium]|nr:M3 family oligoendopeptidase [Gemmataceae bacterium]